MAKKAGETVSVAARGARRAPAARRKETAPRKTLATSLALHQQDDTLDSLPSGRLPALKLSSRSASAQDSSSSKKSKKRSLVFRIDGGEASDDSDDDDGGSVGADNRKHASSPSTQSSQLTSDDANRDGPLDSSDGGSGTSRSEATQSTVSLQSTTEDSTSIHDSFEDLFSTRGDSASRHREMKSKVARNLKGTETLLLEYKGFKKSLKEIEACVSKPELIDEMYEKIMKENPELISKSNTSFQSE